MKRAEKQSGAFTLIELLVVLIILAILGALISTAAMYALKGAREYQITQELSQMAIALEKYRSEHDAYPPSDPADALSHLRSLFRNSTDTTDEFTHEDQALVFWLGGFKPDSERPLTGLGDKTAYFRFSSERLKANQTYCTPIASLSQPYQYESTPDGKAYEIRSAGLDDMWGTEDDKVVRSL